jgi:hypothetical protein
MRKHIHAYDHVFLCSYPPFHRQIPCTCARTLAKSQAAATRRYHSHLENVIALGAEPHLNTCFKHFMYFVTEFSLIERKELEPLKEICAGLGMPLGPLK